MADSSPQTQFYRATTIPRTHKVEVTVLNPVKEHQPHGVLQQVSEYM